MLKHWHYRTLLLALLPLLTACAGTGTTEEGPADTTSTADEAAWDDGWEQGTQDPLEPYNRWVFAFNQTVDDYALRPVAVAYRDYLPTAVRRPIGNALDNLREPFSAGNYYLQGKLGEGSRSTARFLLNTTVGVLGLFDVAGAAGLEQEQTDLGLTLGEWGTPAGPYLVLPLLGPSNIRDTTGLAGRYLTRDYHDPLHWADVESATRYGVTALNIVDTRAELLSLDELMADSGADPYIFMRESYLQNRRERLAEDEWGEWDSGSWEDGGWENGG